MSTIVHSKQKINRVRLRLQRRWRHAGVVMWWRRQNKRYGLLWRVANLAVALLVLLSVLFPVAQNVIAQAHYRLSDAATQLVGKTDQKLAKQLTYDSKTGVYQFNKDAIKSTDTNPLAQLKNQVGKAGGTKKDKSLYALDVPKDMSQGVTYHDINSQLSFSLVPQYKGAEGKAEQGHLVFPLAGGNQAIYTLKNNGLKEDIVVPKVTQDSMTFSYSLKLPKTLEAKVIPNGDGAIGIYSADPALFGNITYSTGKDQANVEKARESGAKTTLVFGLPAPVIKAQAGKSIGSARFALNGSQLSVIATGLSGVKSPITIDPSVVVTSTSDFQTAGNNEGNIDFGTAGQASRGGLTGGSASGGWTATTSFSTIRSGHTSVAYNGYVYIIGGIANTIFQNDIQHCPLNVNGTVGTCVQQTNAFTTARDYHASVVYNGYLYIIGGNANTIYQNDIQHCPLNADGSVGTCVQQTNAFTTARYLHTSVVYNGYLYIIGGTNGTNQNDIQHCLLSADGSVGTCVQQTNAFTTARYGHTSVVYNGYLYIIGGNANSIYQNDIQYCPLSADGSVGTCVQQTNAFTTARYLHTSVVYNGYLYIMGGSSGSSALNDVQYAPINANGTIGTWTATTSFTTARSGHTSVAYNGYLYVIGGYGGANLNDVQYAKIDPPGVTTPYTATTSLTTGRQGHTSVVYNGYLYIMGGWSGGYLNDVQYAPINANGTIGTWTATTSFATIRAAHTSVAYNGYLYVMGGNNVGSYFSDVQYAPINANGTIGTWTATTSFTTARYNHTSVAYNGYLYVIGGYNGGSGVLNNVQYAPINANGTIGTWTATTSFATARSSHTSVVYNGYLYVMGGNSGTPLNDVQYAPISANGTIGTWTATTSFVGARFSHTSVVYNGYLYIMGGKNFNFDLATVQYAPINANGTIGAWTDISSLTTARNSHAAVVYNNYLYVTGGNGGNGLNDVQFATINNGGAGTASAWTATTSLTTARRAHTTVAYNGYLYTMGGTTTGNISLNDVQYAPINANGTVGAWTATTSFPTAREFHTSVAYKGYLYVMGGYGGAYLNDVQYAPINANGTIGVWTATTSLTAGRAYHTSVVYNGYLYVMGGVDDVGYMALNDVRYAPINANGTIGSWTATTSFATARYGHTSVVYNGYLYIMGGTDDGGGNINDVQYAPINANGTIGTWTATTSLTPARYYHTSVVYNGYLYVIGGYNGVSKTNDVQYAPINANGTIGTWTATTAFTTASYHLKAVVYNGYLYIMGGFNSSNAYLNDVQYTSLQSMPRVGRYSKLVDLGSNANVTSITYNGTAPAGAVAVSYRAASSSGIFGSSGLASGVSGSGCSTGNTTNTRYVFVTVTLDDSYGLGTGGGFADINGTPTNLTDLTINFTPSHPLPSIRLHGGKTLQASVLAPLDTCI